MAKSEGQEETIGLTHIDEILRPGVVKRNGYYARSGATAAQTMWDSLANENPIHAAISVRDAAQENLKSGPIIDVLAEELPAGRVLDLGCGYGRVAKYLLAKRTLETYIGVDSSTTMLKLFEQRYNSRRVEKRTPVVLVNSTIEDTLLDDNSVDAVFSCAVLLHNSKPICERAIREAHRVLKPGGKLLLLASFPNKHTMSGVLGAAYHGVYYLKGERDRNGPVRYFSEKEVRGFLGDYGSVEIRRTGFHAIPSRFPFVNESYNEKYRRNIFEPIQSVAGKILSETVKEFACLHIDVIARK
jgi:ubiquinone/menaquinone biosynthesis C-methylase UbiE